MPKPYFLTEFIFQSNYHQSELSAISFAGDFLSNRLSDLLKNGFTSSRSIENVNIPTDGICEEENCPCDYAGFNYHFCIVLDKKSKARLNTDKVNIFKLLHNYKFLSEFKEKDRTISEEIQTLKENGLEIEKGLAEFHELLAAHKISHRYEFAVEALFTSTPDQLLNNLDNFVSSNISYRSYYNGLVYLARFDDPLEPQIDSLTIKTEYNISATKQEIKDSLVIINYFQNKYQSDKQNRSKFAVDKYAELMKLDSDQPHLSDLEKADIILNKGMDLATGKLPTILEDKRKIALIRTMRFRYKEYLKK